MSEEDFAAITAQTLQLAKTILDRPEVDLSASFTSAGGDSLAAIEFAFSLKTSYSWLPASSAVMKKILDTPSLGQLISWLGGEYAAAHRPERAQAPAPAPVATAAVPRRQPFGLLPEQAWFMHEAMPRLARPAHWNDSRLFRFRDGADPEHVREALELLWARHDALLLTMVRTGAGFSQSIADGGAAPAFEVLPENQAGQAAQSALFAACLDIENSLSIFSGPLARAAFLRSSAQGDYLLLAVHHLAADALSMDMLRREFEEIYSRGEAALPPASSYPEYCLGLGRVAHDDDFISAHLTWWLSQPWNEFRTVAGNAGETPPEADEDGSEPVCMLSLEEKAADRLGSQDVLAAIGAACCRWLGGPVALQVVHNGRTNPVALQHQSASTVGRLAMVEIYPAGVCGRQEEITPELIRDEMTRVREHAASLPLLRYMSPPAVQEEIKREVRPRLSGINVNLLGRGQWPRSSELLTEISYAGNLTQDNAPVHPLEIVGGFNGNGLTLHLTAGPGIPRSRLPGLARWIEQFLRHPAG
ncbi:MAG TPA: condensation domain-containing protein [Streptosporangiaceae bacterium]|nr:condensation domain-containing protein [Streptosporangiaceae bacterium]